MELTPLQWKQLDEKDHLGPPKQLVPGTNFTQHQLMMAALRHNRKYLTKITPLELTNIVQGTSIQVLDDEAIRAIGSIHRAQTAIKRRSDGMKGLPKEKEPASPSERSSSGESSDEDDDEDDNEPVKKTPGMTVNKIRRVLRALRVQKWYTPKTIEEGVNLLKPLVVAPRPRARCGEIGKTALKEALNICKVPLTDRKDSNEGNLRLVKKMWGL